jgi:UDP-N-acetylglucosamine acyltransferase
MSNIHPTAVIGYGSKVDPTAQIGPYCVVGENVSIGAGTVLHSHVVVEGHTTIGANNRIFPFASLGHMPQDLKFKGETTYLNIGDGNTIREYVTMNPGTEGGGSVTSVGNNNLFMALAHVAHDCKIGNNCVVANNGTLAGHVEVGDHAIIGGLSAVHQFVRIGHYAIIGGASGVAHDVIPFGSAVGNRAKLMGLNLVGLKRHEFPRDSIHELRKAYRLLFADEGSLADRVEDVAAMFPNNSQIMDICAFIRASDRGICTPSGEAV